MTTIKNQQAILDKLGIEAFNPMQESAHHAIHAHKQVLLLAPTGSGKTLAYLFPIIREIDPTLQAVQAVIITPTRELAIQIEQVIRDMGAGIKAHAFYGGRYMKKDREELKHTPSIIVGTPGRISDHLKRNTFQTDQVSFLILDEYDKSIEIGFQDEMKSIVSGLPQIKKKILTSATKGYQIPDYLKIEKLHTEDHLGDGKSKLKMELVISPEKDKIDTLVDLLKHLGNKSGIVFLNFKSSIDRVSSHLTSEGIPHGKFYGGMEQRDRERSLIKFRNGTHHILLATDLASRGIDIQEMDFIIHYHLPLRAEEFTHRNGRTARMKSEGTAYVLKYVQENLPEFIPGLRKLKLTKQEVVLSSDWSTVMINGGRKDKISKGDIVGSLIKIAGLSKEDIGMIELKTDCAFVAVAANKLDQVMQKLDNNRIKKKKVRVNWV